MYVCLDPVSCCIWFVMVPKINYHICIFFKNVKDTKVQLVLMVATLEVTQPAFSPHLQSWLKSSILQTDGALCPAVLCFTDSVSPAILFLVLLEFVFSLCMCLCLSIHNAVTSIKLWHFSQITWAAISFIHTVTPKSMWVKDTIPDLSTKCILTWDIFIE